MNARTDVYVTYFKSIKKCTIVHVPFAFRIYAHIEMELHVKILTTACECQRIPKKSHLMQRNIEFRSVIELSILACNVYFWPFFAHILVCHKVWLAFLCHFN